MTARPLCATCSCYVAPKELPPAAVLQGIDVRGLCQRYPQSIPKRPEEWCGEHRSPKQGKM